MKSVYEQYRKPRRSRIRSPFWSLWDPIISHTELPFLVWRRFLSEDERFSLYQKVVSMAGGGREVTIWTLDFGGDKSFE